MNHWFYLLAEGTSPMNGQPKSPTCNNTALTGVGHQQAGKNLDPTCALYGKVKAAWQR
ncbi:hypothetical protein [Kribbella qitaiheensis]|uniref:hypothetical protein n=1 Tax=Kribbella qitaiheensis TaxID=1544730 RepID=UPI00162A107C|nr:hypothetical protein [Kribbella qitaiheensis]